MKNNLIPPFVMREAGIRVNDTPKIQTIDPTEKDHSMCFPETDFRIPLSLWGMFSYFVTSRPTAKQMMEAEDVCMLTPSSINPHCDSHATNEENMLDWEGNMAQRKDIEFRSSYPMSKRMLHWQHLYKFQVRKPGQSILSLKATALPMMRRRIRAGSLCQEQLTRSQACWLVCHLRLMIRTCTDV